MGFSTTTFLFVFFPLFMMTYYLSHLISRRIQTCIAENLVIIIASLFFYAWTVKINALLLLIYTIFIWMIGSLIGKKKNKIILVIGIIISLSILFHFKYESVLLYFINEDYESANTIVTPLGLSFITFSVISYFVDIFHGREERGSVMDCMLYILFFPKIVSGPIVLWRDFRTQALSRNISLEGFVAGLNRMVIGLAKKVILADTFSYYAGKMEDQSVLSAWGGWILYALLIYYDFSGYSDMAIGISKMIGFDMKENFDFPYRSLSITEFWRRWHISLGTFFREYIYIPLGGNRKGKWRTLINLTIVFALTGIWHGAGFSYIIWGMIHGLCVLVERIIRESNLYKSVPKCVKWMVTFLISASAWQFFRYGNDYKRAIDTIALLFGKRMGNYDAISNFPWQYYLDAKIVFFAIIGLIGSLLLGSHRINVWYRRMVSENFYYCIQEIGVVVIMFLALIYMISSTYNPFIYFQF